MNELYVVDEQDNRNEEQLEVTTDEEELLAYKHIWHLASTDGNKPKTIQQEEMNTVLDTLREKPAPTHIAKRTEGPITQEQIKSVIRKLIRNDKSPQDEHKQRAPMRLQSFKNYFKI